MDGDPFGLLGTVLDAKFRVDALVGDGDLSVVYKGYHLGHQTPVAIKCLHLPDTLDPALTRPVVEAFEDAGQLQDRLGRASRHIAQTIALGRTIAPRNGVTVPYRVRAWFEGESLASDLARRRRQGAKARTVEEAFALLAPAIDGIARAHEQGFAHLSLDPGNLFLARDDGPCSLKVLDFSTARASHRAEARPTLDSELTRGLHLLRPAYASPEQLDMDLGDPGPWTDVYSLALIMMEVLAERSDVDGRDTAALVERALDRHNRPTPQAHGLTLAPPLDDVLTRAVARNPRKRPQNARVFLSELKAALSHRVWAKVPSKPGRPPPPKPAPLPPLRLPPSSAASGTVATGLGPEAPRIAPVALPPAFSAPHVLPHAGPDLAPLDGEEKSVRRRPFARALWFGASAAALALAGIVATFALLQRRQPSDHHVATPARMAPPAVTSVAPPVASSVVASVAPSVAAPVAAPVAPGVAAPARVASHHAEAGPELPHFSRAAAQRAINAVTSKVKRCRHGRYWGHGYATVVFGDDGSVDRVLVDPPFSTTVAGKCVANALGHARMRSFEGRDGSYRLWFYIAPR